jgi:hypothetical protein
MSEFTGWPGGEPIVVCKRCSRQLEGGLCRPCDQFDSDLSWLMEQPHFRRLFMELTDAAHWCGIGGVNFQLDHATQSYREGRRAIGLQLRAEVMRVAPKTFMRALLEEVADRNQIPIPNEDT